VQPAISVAELRASRSIDVRGLRSLEEKVHLSFDVDRRGTVWMYQFGWLRRREESQIFRVEAESAETRVFAIPEVLQRLPFTVFCVGSGCLYLLGCPAQSVSSPNGFALDTSGRIVGGFHLRASLLDAAADPAGGLWVAGLEGRSPEAQRLVVERLGLDDEVLSSVAAEHWAVGQLSCLSFANGRLLLGGTDSRGATRIELLAGSRLEAIPCENVGPPLSLGFGPLGELFCLSATGQLVRIESGAAAPVNLLDPGGRPLRGLGALRFSYRRLYALSAKRERIWEFGL
jgi:hypothetical protein